ncbi:MAG: succinate dehydrogenase assembly factor 2 [Calditerrivibrio sp.]|nr:succinate dehydrogenase assembly factor 2 [Calditerrivibrio sp.]MCA1980408.1 succinate dehydrogenase assembly factor 2 [Calditerrivibrio sp.]
MIDNPKYKKTVFLCARRAMLENELILRRFATEFVPKNYTIDDLDIFNEFLEKIYDNDLYDVVMGTKPAETYAHIYNIRFLKDIEQFANEARKLGKKLIDEY